MTMPHGIFCGRLATLLVFLGASACTQSTTSRADASLSRDGLVTKDVPPDTFRASDAPATVDAPVNMTLPRGDASMDTTPVDAPEEVATMLDVMPDMTLSKDAPAMVDRLADIPPDAVMPRPDATTPDDGGTCAAPRMLCGTVCINVTSDFENCGRCGRRCGSEEACSGAACLPLAACPAGLMRCAGTCVAVQFDVMNCGRCGTACTGGQVCRNGACECSPGDTVCGGACTNPLFDGANCGRCGNVCPMGRRCRSGSCETSACPPELTACGSMCVNVQTSL